MVWFDMVWCGVIWCDMVWCGVIWCGVVWCDMVWFDMVWCGVVWGGVVCHWVVPYRIEPSWLAGVVPAVLRLDLCEAQLGDRPAGEVGQTAQLASEVHQHLQQQISTQNILRSKFQSFKWRRWL